MSRVALTWKIHWPTTLFAVALLPCLLGLGVWQLHRAEQKRVALAEFEQRREAEPIALAELGPDPALYTRVAARGRYDNEHSFLLDNRISHGRFGYEIITPFLPETAATQTKILVNRGWVEGDPSRVHRPVIEAVEGPVSITGYVYRDTSAFSFVDNGNEAKWPKLVQGLKTDDLQRQLGQAVTPFIFRLDANAPGAFRVEWQVVSVGFGPERHIAYAVTWFTMAVTVVFAWLLMSSNLWQFIKGSSR